MIGDNMRDRADYLEKSHESPAVHYMGKDRQRLFEPAPLAAPDDEVMEVIERLCDQYRATLIALVRYRSAESATHETPDK